MGAFRRKDPRVRSRKDPRGDNDPRSGVSVHSARGRRAGGVFIGLVSDRQLPPLGIPLHNARAIRTYYAYKTARVQKVRRRPALRYALRWARARGRFDDPEMGGR